MKIIRIDRIDRKVFILVEDKLSEYNNVYELYEYSFNDQDSSLCYFCEKTACRKYGNPFESVIHDINNIGKIACRNLQGIHGICIVSLFEMSLIKECIINELNNK